MSNVCVMHYGWFILASLIGSGIGTFLVLRFWKTGELDIDEKGMRGDIWQRWDAMTDEEKKAEVRKAEKILRGDK